MPAIDLHVHTVHSDSELTVAEVARAAKKHHVLCGICDHLSPYHYMYEDAAFDAYVADVRRYDLLLGAEYCVGVEIPVGAAQLARLDYITAGLHSIRLNGRNFFFWGEEFPADAEAFIEAYVGAIITHVAARRPDILAHPTFLPPPLEGLYDELWTEPRLVRLFTAVRDARVALEISGRWLVPHPGPLRLAAEMGLTFAVGSDAHRAGQLFNLTYPDTMINDLGIGEDRIFLPAAARP